ncbi:hypothetical protein K3Z86_14305, partial [Pseudomonas aeruginosa]|nr:hypothetical protein [Pseudomonas aeruginosa]
MSASILNAQNLSKVVGSAEGKLTILHDLSLDLRPPLPGHVVQAVPDHVH